MIASAASAGVVCPTRIFWNSGSTTVSSQPGPPVKRGGS